MNEINGIFKFGGPLCILFLFLHFLGLSFLFRFLESDCSGFFVGLLMLNVSQKGM